MEHKLKRENSPTCCSCIKTFDEITLIIAIGKKQKDNNWTKLFETYFILARALYKNINLKK